MNQNFVPGHLHHLLQGCHRREAVDTWWVDVEMSAWGQTPASVMKDQESKKPGGQEAAGSSKTDTPVSELGRMYVCMHRYMYICIYVCLYFQHSDFSELEWQDEIKFLEKVKDHQVTLHIQFLLKAINTIWRRNIKHAYIYVVHGWLGVRFFQLHPLEIKL